MERGGINPRLERKENWNDERVLKKIKYSRRSLDRFIPSPILMIPLNQLLC